MNWNNIKNLENGFKYEIIAPNGSSGELIINTEPISLLIAEQELEISISGVNTANKAFNESVMVSFGTSSIVDIVQGKKKLNPTKVLWLIYNVAQAVLCPQCNKGFE